MDQKEYFVSTKGTGILATADGDGNVDLAVYATPHFMDDGTIAFVMADRLTHHNLQSNDRAAYMFLEDGQGYKGKRFFLTKLREEQDTELLFSLRSRTYPERPRDGKPRFLVFFRIDKELPLIGAGEEI